MAALDEEEAVAVTLDERAQHRGGWSSRAGLVELREKK